MGLTQLYQLLSTRLQILMCSCGRSTTISCNTMIFTLIGCFSGLCVQSVRTSPHGAIGLDCVRHPLSLEVVSGRPSCPVRLLRAGAASAVGERKHEAGPQAGLGRRIGRARSHCGSVTGLAAGRADICCLRQPLLSGLTQAVSNRAKRHETHSVNHTTKRLAFPNRRETTPPSPSASSVQVPLAGRLRVRLSRSQNESRPANVLPNRCGLENGGGGNPGPDGHQDQGLGMTVTG